MVDNQIGLQALFDNEDFQKGISDYNGSISDATANTESAGSAMSEVWNGLASAGETAFNAIGAGVVAAAGIVAAAVGTITAAVFSAADAAGELVDLSTKTGISVTSLQELQFVGDQVGTSLDTITGAQTRLIRSMASGSKAFNTLGIAVKDSNGNLRDQQEVFTEVIDALGGIQNPAERDALAMELFGKSAQELNPLIKAGSAELARLKDEAHEVGAVMSEDAVFGLESFGDTIASIKAGLKGILGTLAAEALPAFESIATALQDLFKSEVFQKRIQEIGRVIGTIADLVAKTFSSISESIQNFPDDPIGFIADLFYKLGFNLEKLFDIKGANNFFSNFADGFIKIAEALKEFYENSLLPFLQSNAKEIIIGILAAIGVAMAAFAINAAAAAIATAVSFAPIIAAIAAIAAVVALFVKAWDEDWGGIQGKVAAAWAQLKPVFQQVQAWLKVNLPKALKVLADFWSKILLPAIKVVVIWIIDNVLPALVDLELWLAENIPNAIKATSDFFKNTLLPAIKTIGDWIENTLIPILTEMRDWFQTHIVNGIKTLITIVQGALTAALQSLSALWTNVLLPAITIVYNFIQNNIIPIFNAVSNLINAVLSVAIRALAGLWQNLLLPAIQAVVGFVQNLISSFNSMVGTMSGPLTTAINAVAKIWREVFQPAIQAVWDKLMPFADFLSNTLKKAFDSILTVIHNVVDWIDHLADSINNLTLPDFLTPGSPTPFEIGLVGINEQLKKLASASLPAIRHQMEVLATVRDVPGLPSRFAAASVSNSSQSTRNYLFGANFNLPGPSGLIESLQNL